MTENNKKQHRYPKISGLIDSLVSQFVVGVLQNFEWTKLSCKFLAGCATKGQELTISF